MTSNPFTPYLSTCPGDTTCWGPPREVYQSDWDKSDSVFPGEGVCVFIHFHLYKGKKQNKLWHRDRWSCTRQLSMSYLKTPYLLNSDYSHRYSCSINLSVDFRNYLLPPTEPPVIYCRCSTVTTSILSYRTGNIRYPQGNENHTHSTYHWIFDIAVRLGEDSVYSTLYFLPSELLWHPLYLSIQPQSI